MSRHNILLCMGTRPEIIKMAPVYHELVRRGMQPLLLHTGQHSDMANPIYDYFDIVPDYSLHLQRKSDTLYHLSALLLEKLGGAFSTINPRAVLVHGDTTSAAMAALTAFYQKIPVGHVEAGLRSYQEYDPFPEEKNRDIIARLAHWHFAPTDQAAQNLRLEHIEEPRIHLVGNTVVDAVRMATTMFKKKMESNLEINSGALKKLPTALESGRLLLVTAHRRENLGEPLVQIARAVRELLESAEDFVVVWPVHSNPKVRATVHEVFEHMPADMEKRIFLTKPLNYSTTLWLLGKAWLVLTDSGGIQEEAACMKAPVLVLRETTERPELIQGGGGMLIGTDGKTIVSRVRKLLNNKSVHDAMLESPNPFGDGFAAARICDIIARDGFVPEIRT